MLPEPESESDEKPETPKAPGFGPSSESGEKPETPKPPGFGPSAGVFPKSPESGSGLDPDPEPPEPPLGLLATTREAM